MKTKGILNYAIIVIVIFCSIYGIIMTQKEREAKVFIETQNQLIKDERDSLIVRNQRNDTFYTQQIDSMYVIIDQLSHTKSLSKQQINALKERIDAQENARKTYLQNINK